MRTVGPWGEYQPNVVLVEFYRQRRGGIPQSIVGVLNRFVSDHPASLVLKWKSAFYEIL